MLQDGDLVRQTLAGQPRAYEELVRRWGVRITALCHARTGRSDVADDLAQETLLRGYRGLRSLAAPEKFGAWLRGIASRTCLDWIKAKQRTEVPFSSLCPTGNTEELLGAGAVEKNHADHDEDLARLMSAVEELPEQYREVLMLYYYEDVTYRDLAETLGVSTATINARLTKARAMLRERLNPTPMR